MLLAAGTLIDHPMVAGPTVIANPTPEQPLQTEDQQNQPNEMDVFQPAGQPAGNTLPQIFQYGEVQLRPHMDYQLLYGTGIQSAPGNQQNMVIQELAPGVAVDLGPHWALDYTPTIRFYSSKQFQDGVDHSATLTGGVNYEAWSFGLSHSSQITSAPMVETGTQTDQSTHTTTLTASRALDSNTSADFAVNQNINLVSGLDDSYDWNTLDWVNYKFWPRLNAGIGVGGGYVLVEGNSQLNGTNNLDQTYEELEARVNWRATDKISFQVNGGLEDRQFATAGSGDSLSPVFGASIQYQPFQATQISLNASRTVSSSDYYLAAQQTETTLVSLGVNQRLMRKFTLAASVAYSQMDYSTPSGGASANLANRTDDMVSFNARLSHPFLKRGTWSVFYQYSENSSSQSGFGFQSNQTGLEISYSY
jgi:hypothetical protein